MEKIKNEQLYGKKITTVKELKEILNDLDDNDYICIEALDNDLYPMNIDVIEGVCMIGKEVRFCQMPNNK